MAPKRNVAAVVTLFFVAPLVAEFLLGDFPITWLPLLLLLAPTYGGGALLIRETARRAGRGWPTMLLLGAAYALFAEGFTTQSLFNPNYLKMNMHWLSHAYLPALGIGGWWTLLMLNVHVFWSIGVSIGLVEALWPEEARSPWLGRVGDAVVAGVFVAGSVFSTVGQLKRDSFVASHTQFFWTAVICVVLTGVVFLIPAHQARVEGGVPSPWLIGLGVFAMGMVIVFTQPKWGWGACGMILAVDAVFVTLTLLLSRRSGWGAVHTLSVAAGGAVVYGVHAFVLSPVVPASRVMVRVGNGIFLAAALALITIGARRSAREPGN